MINIITGENLLNIEIPDSAGIEDSSLLKNDLQSGIETNREIRIILKENISLHISICVVIFAAAIEANKKNIKLNLTDNSEILENTFYNLGLLKEYSDVIEKLKDRG